MKITEKHICEDQIVTFKQSHILLYQGLLFLTRSTCVIVDARSHTCKSHDFIPRYDIMFRFHGRIEIDHSYGLRCRGLCCHSRHSTHGAGRRGRATAGPTRAVPGVAAQTTPAQTVSWSIPIFTIGTAIVLGIPIGGKCNMSEESDLRILTFKGKTELIQSMGISNVLYTMEVKNLNHNEIISSLWDFLWDGKKRGLVK